MHELLNLMFSDMEQADKLYKPTQFWINASQLILNELRTDRDFENFKSLPISREMFVPRYEHYYYKKHKKFFDLLFTLPFKKNLTDLFKKALTGENQAKNDYRLFLATSTPDYPDLSIVAESTIGAPIDTFTFDNKLYSQGLLNYLRGLNLLKRHVDCRSIKRIIELGGGFGTLGEIVQKSFSDTFYLNVDIPPVASISTYYLTRLLGRKNVCTYDQCRNMEIIDIEEISKKYKCAIICPWQLQKVRGNFDLFVNFISFQEMEPDVVRNYTSIFDKLTNNFILLRNSKHGKLKATKAGDVGVINPVTLDFTIDEFSNFELIQRDFRVYGFYSDRSASEVALLRRKV